MRAIPAPMVDRMPANVRSVADNYNHLHEQPTIFYALMFFAALTGGADHVATYLAWVMLAAGGTFLRAGSCRRKWRCGS